MAPACKALTVLHGLALSPDPFLSVSRKDTRGHYFGSNDVVNTTVKLSFLCRQASFMGEEGCTGDADDQCQCQC